VKLTEEEKQRIEKYDARLSAQLQIWVIANKLFLKSETLWYAFLGIGFIFSGVCSLFLFMGLDMKDRNSSPLFMYLGFSLFLIGAILFNIVMIYQSKRSKWQKQALTDWEKTGELPK
jgi:hypothetical protein